MLEGDGAFSTDPIQNLILPPMSRLSYLHLLALANEWKRFSPKWGIINKYDQNNDYKCFQVILTLVWIWSEIEEVDVCGCDL